MKGNTFCFQKIRLFCEDARKLLSESVGSQIDAEGFRREEELFFGVIPFQAV